MQPLWRRRSAGRSIAVLAVAAALTIQVAGA